MGSKHENKLFCPMDYVPKINTKRDMRCCGLLYVTSEGGSRLRATIRFAQRRLQLTQLIVIISNVSRLLSTIGCHMSSVHCQIMDQYRLHTVANPNIDITELTLDIPYFASIYRHNSAVDNTELHTKFSQLVSASTVFKMGLSKRENFPKVSPKSLEKEVFVGFGSPPKVSR